MRRDSAYSSSLQAYQSEQAEPPSIFGKQIAQTKKDYGLVKMAPLRLNYDSKLTVKDQSTYFTQGFAGIRSLLQAPGLAHLAESLSALNLEASETNLVSNRLDNGPGKSHVRISRYSSSNSPRVQSRERKPPTAQTDLSKEKEER